MKTQAGKKKLYLFAAGLVAIVVIGLLLLGARHADAAMPSPEAVALDAR